MEVSEAKELLSYHSGRNSDIHNSKWERGFLGSLRPFRGELYEENFIEVMECLKVLQHEFEASRIDKEIVSDIVEITYLTRVWSSKGGMLERNNLLTQQQTEQLQLWVDIIEETFVWLLEGAYDEAFSTYGMYCENPEELY